MSRKNINKYMIYKIVIITLIVSLLIKCKLSIKYPFILCNPDKPVATIIDHNFIMKAFDKDCDKQIDYWIYYDKDNNQIAILEEEDRSINVQVEREDDFQREMEILK
jgi:hypothetical protein